MVSRIFTSWNRLDEWLRQVEGFAGGVSRAASPFQRFPATREDVGAARMPGSFAGVSASLLRMNGHPDLLAGRRMPQQQVTGAFPDHSTSESARASLVRFPVCDRSCERRQVVDSVEQWNGEPDFHELEPTEELVAPSRAPQACGLVRVTRRPAKLPQGRSKSFFPGELRAFDSDRSHSDARATPPSQGVSPKRDGSNPKHLIRTRRSRSVITAGPLFAFVRRHSQPLLASSRLMI